MREITNSFVSNPICIVVVSLHEEKNIRTRSLTKDIDGDIVVN